MADKTQQTISDSIRIGSFEVGKGLLIALFYLFMSILMNLINRILFQSYDFIGFNFTFLLLQQITACFAFNLIFSQFANYNEKVGPISLKEFMTLKYEIFLFAALFISNLYFSFLSNQVLSTAIFLVLRKFLILFTYIYKRVIQAKELPNYFGFSVLFILFGALLSAVLE